jgi:exodeoxyribonuclease-1
MIASVKVVTPEVAQRTHLDLALVRKHYDELMLNQTSWMKAQAVFSGQDFAEKTDPDAMLYSGGFFSNIDKNTLARIVKTPPADLSRQTFVFEDRRLAEMFFRYKARNYPELLDVEESERWQEYRFQRLTNPDYGATITLQQYQEKLEDLFEQYESDEKKSAIIDDLMSWGDGLL